MQLFDHLLSVNTSTALCAKHTNLFFHWTAESQEITTSWSIGILATPGLLYIGNSRHTVVAVLLEDLNLDQKWANISFWKTFIPDVNQTYGTTVVSASSSAAQSNSVCHMWHPKHQHSLQAGKSTMWGCCWGILIQCLLGRFESHKWVFFNCTQAMKNHIRSILCRVRPVLEAKGTIPSGFRVLVCFPALHLHYYSWILVIWGRLHALSYWRLLLHQL